MERRRALSGASLLALGQIAGQGCAVVRNVVLARALAPESFGIATTLALVASFLDSISYLATDRLIVQSRVGDSPRFVATAHFLQATRGLLLALLVLAAAWPLARYFNATTHFAAYALVALVPLLRGLSHLELNVQQRDLRFGVTVGVDLIGQGLSLGAAIAIGHVLKSPMAMAWVLVIQAAATMLASHLLARSPYRMAWDRAFGRQLLAFGWPMLVNGGLMFVIFEGDRFVIGPGYGPIALGWYGAALLLATAPTAALVRVVASVGLPLLAAKQDELEVFRRRYELISGATTACSVLFSVGAMVAGPTLVELMYGPEFAPASTLLCLLAAMQAMRLLRVAPTLAALAKADSMNSMASNAVRVLGFPIAIAAAIRHAPLAWIPTIGLAAEAVAGVAAAVLAQRRHSLPARSSFLPWMLAVLFATASLPLASAVRSLPSWLVVTAGLLAAGTAALLVVAALPSTRRETHRLARSILLRVTAGRAERAPPHAE